MCGNIVPLRKLRAFVGSKCDNGMNSTTRKWAGSVRDRCAGEPVWP